jgi:hypothetical protein
MQPAKNVFDLESARGNLFMDRWWALLFVCLSPENELKIWRMMLSSIFVSMTDEKCQVFVVDFSSSSFSDCTSGSAYEMRPLFSHTQTHHKSHPNCPANGHKSSYANT